MRRFYVEVETRRVVSGWVEADDKVSAGKRAVADEWEEILGESDLPGVSVRTIRPVSDEEIRAHSRGLRRK